MGPNVKKLIIRKMACEAIPNGGGLKEGIEFLMSGGLVDSAKRATEWANLAIQTVRLAAEPNQYIASTDEEIAAEILRQLEQRTKQKSV